MNFVNEAGSYKRLSATTTATLVSGPCVLWGASVASVLSGQIVQLWDGSDATLAAGTIVVGTCTLAANTQPRFPAMLNSGLTIQVINDDVDITFYYSPAGGNT